MPILQSGVRAPEFELSSGLYEQLSLSELRGRPVVLAFYSSDWNPLCTAQLAEYNAILADLATYDALLMGISVDSKWSHAAYAQDQHLGFPLLADFEPRGQTAKAYGTYRKQEGMSERALFLIDADGTIRWSFRTAIGSMSCAQLLLDALPTLLPQAAR
jgi:peroxiredoxin